MSAIKKTDHFYLVDGSGYIFRAYYALPPLSRKSDGLPTGAVSGFSSMLFKLLEEVRSDDSKNKPTHFAVIFDSARKNFRNEIYKDYKANRSEAPDDFITVPAKIFINVVFPAPFGPKSPKISPCFTSKLKFFSAKTSCFSLLLFE